MFPCLKVFCITTICSSFLRVLCSFNNYERYHQNPCIKIQFACLLCIPGTEWECIMGKMHSFSQRGAVVVKLSFGVKKY